MRIAGAHLGQRLCLFGARPSLADFGLFGGNAAHFVNDPLCRRWTDEDAPSVVQHTHRLLEPEDQPWGPWNAPGDVPDTLISLLAEIGRLYLPWVSRACIEGQAEIAFTGAPRPLVHATEFLRDARATLLARYLAHRSRALDEVLERAGILSFFADYTGHAGSIPDYQRPPQPALNRPYPPEGVV
jgi:hypothetical protein